MIILPVIPPPGLLLLPGIDLLLVTIGILLILLPQLLLPLRPNPQILHLHIGHLLEGHRRLVAVGCPHFVDDLAAFVFGAAVVALWVVGGQEELLLDLFGFTDVPDF